MPPRPRVLYWFRTDLRLHDSPALKAALELEPEVLWPVWTWDPHYVYEARVGVNRWGFLINCQNDLSRSITRLNPKSKLFVIREAPQTLLPKLFREWRVSHLVFEKDTDAYGRERDEVVMAAASEAGVQVIVKSGRTLWDSDLLVQKNGGRPTMSISQVQTAGPKVGKIPRPLDAPAWLPDPGEVGLQFEGEVPVVGAGMDLNGEGREREDRSFEALAGPQGDFAVPTLEELGFPAATTMHQGGETIALQSLDRIIADETYTATFEKPKSAPTAFDPASTTLLSPHLHFGSLSVRLFYWRVQDVVSAYNKKGTASSPPVSLTGQLLFRDMYFGAHAALGHSFGQTQHNPSVRFIPWHLPTLIDPSTKRRTANTSTNKPYTIDDPVAEAWFQRWKAGLTGFPWIDALMRQLRLEGWIHHLGRHAVACFLTRGGCYVSWERGADVFEEWLIDHETACNAGNWQWLSCTAFFAQFFRVYSPVAFPKKWDPEATFVKRYVPELGKLGKKWVYEPWLAGKKELEAAGVRLVGEGEEGWEDLLAGRGEEGLYPKPMFDFAERRDRCLEGMKEAYKVGLHGNDARVVDGSWKSLFAAGDVGGVGDVGSGGGNRGVVSKNTSKTADNRDGSSHSHGTEDALQDGDETTESDDDDAGSDDDDQRGNGKDTMKKRPRTTSLPNSSTAGNGSGSGSTRGRGRGRGGNNAQGRGTGGAQATLDGHVVKKSKK